MAQTIDSLPPPAPWENQEPPAPIYQAPKDKGGLPPATLPPPAPLFVPASTPNYGTPALQPSGFTFNASPVPGDQRQAQVQENRDLRGGFTFKPSSVSESAPPVDVNPVDINRLSRDLMYAPDWRVDPTTGARVNYGGIDAGMMDAAVAEWYRSNGATGISPDQRRQAEIEKDRRLSHAGRNASSTYIPYAPAATSAGPSVAPATFNYGTLPSDVQNSLAAYWKGTPLSDAMNVKLTSLMGTYGNAMQVSDLASFINALKLGYTG
jgi:hypothetical protein